MSESNELVPIDSSTEIGGRKYMKFIHFFYFCHRDTSFGNQKTGNPPISGT